VKDNREDVAEEDAEIEECRYVKDPFPCPMLKSIDMSK
jgi:hypothetical protein